MTLIETISEFETFLEQSKNYDWIIVPTYCNGSRPVYTDSISIVYIYVLNLDKEVLVVFNHTEGLSLTIDLLILHIKCGVGAIQPFVLTLLVVDNLTDTKLLPS